MQAGMLTTWGTVGAKLSAELGNVAQEADPSESDRHTWELVAYVMSGLSALLLIVSLFMIPRIKVRRYHFKLGVGRAWKG